MQIDQWQAQKAADHYYNLIRKNFDPNTIAPEHTEFEHLYRRLFPIINGNDSIVGYSNGDFYPSVTKKLEVIPHPGLLKWHVNKVVNDIQLHWMPDQSYNEDEIEKILADAKQVPINEFEGAGTLGSQVHNMRADYFTEWIRTGVRPVGISVSSTTDLRVVSCWRALQKFLDDTGYIPVRTEMLVYDDKLKLGGTLDDIGIIPEVVNGKQFNNLVLMDLKTSNQLKNSYHYQVALYYHMASKLFRMRPKQAFILKLSKEDGTYEIEYLKDIPQLIKEAKLLLKVGDSLDRVTEARKKDIITI